MQTHTNTLLCFTHIFIHVHINIHMCEYVYINISQKYISISLSHTYTRKNNNSIYDFICILSPSSSTGLILTFPPSLPQDWKTYLILSLANSLIIQFLHVQRVLLELLSLITTKNKPINWSSTFTYSSFCCSPKSMLTVQIHCSEITVCVFFPFPPLQCCFRVYSTTLL